jgi:glycosyltransferase involved in cell wall biosynthesis
MKVAVFVNSLGLGGTEKAACRWARGLRERGHDVVVLTLVEGPRRAELEYAGIDVRVLVASPAAIADELRARQPDAIHAHAPGQRHEGDVLGEALAALPKRAPIVQTNIFGKFDNPREDQWTDFRLFISWTSCVQAARRSFQSLNLEFFRRASVAVYPLDPDDGPGITERAAFRQRHGVRDDEVLFGRLSRPEPNKWTDLTLFSFRRALRKNPQIKLLLREPPPAVTQNLATAPDRDRFLILKATSDRDELRRTLTSLDVVLHTSSMGESFGYGIAEPMNFGKPVIANSTPWADQAQIELVRHGECGYITSTELTMADAILQLAGDESLRVRLGHQAQQHIRRIADPDESLDRLEDALCAASTSRQNARAAEDLTTAQAAAVYLDQHQFGNTFEERCALYPLHYRVRFHEWRKAVQAWLKTKARLR